MNSFIIENKMPALRHFVIVAQIRTGYQYLVNMLHCHPKVLTLGEIFVPFDQVRIDSLFKAPIPPFEMGQYPPEYIAKVVDTYALSKGYSIAGCKLNYDQVVYEELLDCMVIHLTRKNLLDRLLSQKLAIQEDRWNFKDYATTVEITAEELIWRSEQSLAWQQDVRSHLATHEVVYEDLVARPEEVMNGVQQYLGVEVHKLKHTLPKQRRGSQSQYISNYQQLAQELHGTDYEAFLTG